MSIVTATAESNLTDMALQESAEKQKAFDAISYDVSKLDDYGYCCLTVKANGAIVYKGKVNIASDSDLSKVVSAMIGSPKTTLSQVDKIDLNQAVGKVLADADEPSFSLPKARFIGDMITSPLPQPKAVVEGLFRETEVCQIVAAPKTNKTWTMLAGVLAVATGRKFLDTWPTNQGKVLHIDAELLPGTLDWRYKTVADAMDIDPSDLVDMNGNSRIVTHCIRDNPKTIDELTQHLPTIYAKGQFSLIVLDALYKFYPPRFNENDNADQARLFSQLVQLGAAMNAAVMVVHHASKGNQGAKAITDVGSGGGSMSRAADSYLILREHEMAGCAVFDGVTRSFQNPEPVTLKWNFPVWEVKAEIAPEVKQRVSAHTEKEKAKDETLMERIIERFKSGKPFTWKDATAVGAGKGRTQRLIAEMVDAGKLAHHSTFQRTGARTESDHYTVDTNKQFDASYSSEKFKQEWTAN